MGQALQGAYCRAVAPIAFVDHCLELLAPLGAVRSRRMFGGWGLYLDELFVAIVFGEQLYLKADETSRARFAAAGCTPFVYRGGGREITMGYWTAPPEALDSPPAMAPWARLALGSALAARAAAALKRPRRGGGAPRATKGPARR